MLWLSFRKILVIFLYSYKSTRNPNFYSLKFHACSWFHVLTCAKARYKRAICSSFGLRTLLKNQKQEQTQNVLISFKTPIFGAKGSNISKKQSSW